MDEMRLRIVVLGLSLVLLPVASFPTVVPNKSTQSSLAAIINRREWIEQSFTTAASSVLVGTDDNVSTPTTRPTVLMTGCTSGIGLQACKLLAETHTLILAGRTLAKAQAAAAQIASDHCHPIACNLASQSSIRQCAQNLPPIDRLVLNAGVARNASPSTPISRTVDGLEETVGVNHFGHALLRHLVRLTPDARIVVTASGVHDPESPGGAQGVPATLGDLGGLRRAEFEMVDGGSFNADKAYKDSKLCNVFYAQELQRRLARSDATKNVVVNAMNPGLIVGTGLFRDQNPLFTKVFDVAATNLLKVGETPEWGGAALAYMVTSVETRGLYYSSPPGSSKYGNAAFGNQFGPTTVSKEAQDVAKGEELWELTEKILGIPA